MFRLTIITDDKKLPKLLRAFKGLIIGPPEVFLLEGAEEVDGTLREATEDQQTSSNGRLHPSPRKGRGAKAGTALKKPGETLPDHVVVKLLKEKPSVITAEVLRKATKDAGSTENSYSYVVVALRKWGIMTGPSPAGIYTLNEAAYHRRIEGSP